MMKKALQILITVWFLVGSPAAWAQQGQYTIGLPCLEYQTCASSEAEAFFTEVYGRIGIVPAFAYLPRLRDLEDANDGHTDACAGRTKASYQPYENLIPVKTPVATETIVAFTLKEGLRIDSWKDISSLRVGIVRGAQLPLQLCKQKGIERYVVGNTLQQVFHMLAESRVDAVVHHLQVGLNTARSIGIPVRMSNVLYRDMVYHVLNRRHAGLAPKLARIFGEMLEDGTSARLLGKWAGMLPEPLE
ncbi:transporter substrate-binding domain-containing protein [uncultured Pseudodesulfovibrio sp.]|uniref:substrate-binding periplasmic protein n=1 Tax=uncultured Pseudodesulfovibrio sp. TaxID=2035858 RepID=UPI0029C6A5CB|nr:transporter substrate-binding domain-containing protein [uncultured Pseudodesulfovibrio sp.]